MSHLLLNKALIWSHVYVILAKIGNIIDTVSHNAKQSHKPMIEPLPKGKLNIVIQCELRCWRN